VNLGLTFEETEMTVLTDYGLTNALEGELNRWGYVCDVRFASGEKDWKEELGRRGKAAQNIAARLP
jgi:hypothetical protein